MGGGQGRQQATAGGRGGQGCHAGRAEHWQAKALDSSGPPLPSSIHHPQQAKEEAAKAEKEGGGKKAVDGPATPAAGDAAADKENGADAQK